MLESPAMVPQLPIPEPLRSACQIAILAVLLYYVLKFLRRTRAYRILAGIVAVLLGLLVCGIAAFLLIEKLQSNPGKIGEFYYTFIK